MGGPAASRRRCPPRSLPLGRQADGLRPAPVAWRVVPFSVPAPQGIERTRRKPTWLKLIVDPLPNVAAHVVRTPSVRGSRRHWIGLEPTVGIVPSRITDGLRARARVAFARAPTGSGSPSWSRWSFPWRCTPSCAATITFWTSCCVKSALRQMACSPRQQAWMGMWSDG